MPGMWDWIHPQDHDWQPPDDEPDRIERLIEEQQKKGNLPDPDDDKKRYRELQEWEVEELERIYKIPSPPERKDDSDS